MTCFVFGSPGVPRGSASSYHVDVADEQTSELEAKICILNSPVCFFPQGEWMTEHMHTVTCHVDATTVLRGHFSDLRALSCMAR